MARKFDKSKGGRPTIYSKELADTICVRLADGESLRSICEDENMPTKSTILLWVVDGEHAEFSDQYSLAREAQGHGFADSLIDLHQAVRDGELDERKARVIQDGVKWQAERLARKQYGQRQEVELNDKRGTVADEPMSPEDWAAHYASPGVEGERTH